MDVERTAGTNEKGKERRTKKFNGGKITDNIMRGVIMLIMAVVCVMISDQIIATPYFSAEIEVRFFHGSVFGITLLTVIAYIISIFVLWCLCNLNLDFLITPAENISDDVFVRVIRSLNFNKHYQDFVSGQIGLDNVIYFFSVMIPALWLNVIALEFKKK